MEERPRFGQEQPDDDEEVNSSSSPRRIPSWKGNEKFWSRWMPEEAGTEQSEKTRENDDEEEEDDDDDDRTIKGILKRRRKPKKRLSGSLLDVAVSNPYQQQEQLNSENIEPIGYYETWSPTAVDNIIESAVPPVENTNDTLNETLEVSHEITEQVQVPEINASETAEAPEPSTPELVTVAVEPVAEPESIETILQRRNIQNRLDRDDHDNQEVGGYTLPAKEALPAAQNKPEVVQKPVANVGLHLLNYALALRRDNKNKASAAKEFKRVDQDIDKILQAQKVAKDTYPGNKPEIPLFKTQQVSQAEKHIDNTRLNVKQEIQSVKNANIVEKTTNIYEKQSFEPIKSESILRNVEQPTKQEMHQPTAERSLQEQEQFMQKVVEAVERKPTIESEFAFERRHEVMDSQDDNSSAQKQGNIAYTEQPVSTGYNSYSQGSQGVLRPNSTSEKKSDEYKQAALSGAWGAVVGVVVFIAFYILTNG